jgi:hypothetical protein
VRRVSLIGLAVLVVLLVDAIAGFRISVTAATTTGTGDLAFVPGSAIS